MLQYRNSKTSLSNNLFFLIYAREKGYRDLDSSKLLYPQVPEAVKTLTESAESNQKVQIRTWGGLLTHQNYTTPTPSLDSLSLLISSFGNSIEAEIVDKLDQIDEVIKVYYKEDNNFISVKILLTMPTYDFELIDKLLNRVEYPVKDQYKNKLINFEYIPYTKGDQEQSENKNMLQIFNRELQEIIYLSTVTYSYIDPVENFLTIPQWQI